MVLRAYEVKLQRGNLFSNIWDDRALTNITAEWTEQTQGFESITVSVEICLSSVCLLCGVRWPWIYWLKWMLWKAWLLHNVGCFLSSDPESTAWQIQDIFRLILIWILQQRSSLIRSCILQPVKWPVELCYMCYRQCNSVIKEAYYAFPYFNLGHTGTILDVQTLHGQVFKHSYIS